VRFANGDTLLSCPFCGAEENEACARDCGELSDLDDLEPDDLNDSNDWESTP
jgi:hypothetical protein